MMQPMQSAHAGTARPRVKQEYIMETVVVVNKVTGRKTYYLFVCDVLRRIGKADHDKIVREAYKASCMVTKGAANPDIPYIRHFTTWHSFL